MTERQDWTALTGPTIKDRINHPYILANQILTIQKAILNLDNSALVTQEAVEGLIHAIPRSWKDAEFDTELKDSHVEDEEDVRPEFCGVKASEQYCKDHGIEITHKSTRLDHWKAMEACVNLLDRRGMLSKKQFTEIMTGKTRKPGNNGFEDTGE